MSDTWTLVSGYTASDYADDMVWEVDTGTKKLVQISGQALVAGEENSQYIVFKMDRYWDGIDISGMTINIMYELNTTYFGTSTAVAAEITDDSLRFGWIVPAEACCVTGTLLFVLVITDTDYTLKTQIATTSVYSTISEDDVVPEPTSAAWYEEFQTRVDAALDNAENALSQAQSVLAQAQTYVGAPLVASTAAEMTDTSRVYVYVGSEDGYTSGNWYYYNGSAWTSGGVYNAVAVNTDTTLTQSGRPADAKATGDAISALNADLQSNVFRATKTIAVDDLDNYMTNGAYLVNNSSIAHIPYAEQGTLLVFAYNTTGIFGYVQIYVTNSQNKIFYRAYVGNSAWKNWIEISSVTMLSDVTDKAFTERSVATSDLNNYLVNGAYLVNSTISNAPYESANGLLTVFTWNQTNAYGLMQMFVSNNASISPYYRFRWNSVWSGWMTFAPQIDIDVVEKPKNVNVLNPSNFTLKGYISAQDGTTFTSNSNYMCTNDFIDVPFGTQSVYAKFPQTENNDRICCFLFYDAGGNYTFSASGRLNGYDYKSATWNTTNNVAKVKFWVNKTTVSGGSNDVCISFSNPTDFVEYEGEYKVDDKSLENPQIYLPLAGKKIVCFGDSIFGNKQSPFGVTDALADITGAKVYNIGFGGCNMSERSNATWDAFSMYRLAYAIANNDFSLQDTAINDTTAGLLSYFPSTLSSLKSIDFNNVDIITIAFGTNDFTGNIVLDNQTDPDDTTKFCGALRYSLDRIMAAFPHIKIFVCGQTYRFWMDSNNVFIDDSDTRENGNGDKLTDFVVATKSVSDEYHVPFIDNYFGLGINSYNRGYYFPANDGTHHNYKGAKLIAEHIKHELF